MSDTDIVTRLAREAGFEWDACNIGHAGLGTFARFAALVAEECAKECEKVYVLQEDLPAGESYLYDAARAIRARFVHSPKP